MKKKLFDDKGVMTVYRPDSCATIPNRLRASQECASLAPQRAI